MLKNKEINHRVKLTKYLIREALLELLKTRNINKISILELCKVAGVNRSTFYNHYGSQYDVLNEVINIYIESTSLAIINNLAAGKSIEDCLINVLQYIKDNIEFAKLIISQENYYLIPDMKKVMPNFDDLLIKNLPNNMNLEEKRALSSYVQYGTIRLLKEWILLDCKRPPKEEVKLILNIIGRTMNDCK